MIEPDHIADLDELGTFLLGVMVLEQINFPARLLLERHVGLEFVLVSRVGKRGEVQGGLSVLNINFVD